jgi:flavorubredoxin
MKRAIVLYDTKYGNTGRVAEAIHRGLESSGVKSTLAKIEELHTDELGSFDLIVFGCPNHNQSPSLTMLKYIDRVAATGLKNKLGASFDTYTGFNKGIALRKLEAHLRERLPGVSIIMGGLSAKVRSRTGPVEEEELPKSEAFGTELGTRLAAHA